ncbi:MAG: hypothetical protein JOZ15_05320, partial [Acidobacteria bacterium]|nr:hypothetical protein [Acidobacteriota bacterium]
MRKLNRKKLRLSADTILVLDRRLQDAAGGATTAICNSIAPSCTVTLCG